MPLLRESKAVVVEYFSQVGCLAAFNVPSIQLLLDLALYILRIFRIELLDLLKELVV